MGHNSINMTIVFHIEIIFFSPIHTEKLLYLELPDPEKLACSVDSADVKDHGAVAMEDEVSECSL